MHVGTRDPVDRVGTSRKRLLGYRRHRGREDEQSEDPACPLGAAREYSYDGAKTGGCGQHAEKLSLRQQT